MNERIQKLIEQATHVEEPDGLFLREVFDPKKFAELIVKECIDIAYREGDNVAYLALYFGVEE